MTDDLTAREDAAEAMVPVALRLVGAVHDDGPEAVAEVLHEVDPKYVPALLVVLAAMVDPTKTPQALIGWVDAAVLPIRFLDEDDARTWPDDAVHRLWMDYRRKRGPAVSPWLEERRLKGYREWERRRKARERESYPHDE